MAADLGEFMGDESDAPIRSKRLSFAAMTQDNAASVTPSPISAPIRATPPHGTIALERPALENFMSTSSSSSNTPGINPARQFGALDHDIAKLAQTVSFPFPLIRMKLILPLAAYEGCKCKTLQKFLPLLAFILTYFC